MLDEHTGHGHFTRCIAAESTPIVTAPSCDIEAFLDAREIPYTVAGRFHETTEYRAVTAFQELREWLDVDGRAQLTDVLEV